MVVGETIFKAKKPQPVGAEANAWRLSKETNGPLGQATARWT